jgi:uncharacterized SAM-binding protein YcdF (DUF218 family)
MMKKFGLTLIPIGVAGVIWGLYQYWSISKIGEEAQPQKADVILILGAAVWENGPSPALMARINHAADLFRKGYAKHLILSGGLGTYPPTEAEMMKRKLLELKIDANALFLEDRSTSTEENIYFSKQIMERNGWKSAIIVTDTFHMKRALLLARDAGIEAFGSSAKNSVLYKNKSLRFKYTMREVMALTQYYFLRLFK